MWSINNNKGFITMVKQLEVYVEALGLAVIIPADTDKCFAVFHSKHYEETTGAGFAVCSIHLSNGEWVKGAFIGKEYKTQQSALEWIEKFGQDDNKIILTKENGATRLLARLSKEEVKDMELARISVGTLHFGSVMVNRYDNVTISNPNYISRKVKALFEKVLEV